MARNWSIGAIPEPEPVTETEPSFVSDVKRVALNVADTPFRLASDFVVGPLFKLAGDEDYDYSAQETGRKRR